MEEFEKVITRLNNNNATTFHKVTPNSKATADLFSILDIGDITEEEIVIIRLI